MAKLGRRKILKVSLEAVKGTAVAGAIDLLCYDPQLNPEDNTIQREPSGAFGGQARAQRGPAVGTCKFKCELRSDGINTLDAGLLACFQACGLMHAAGVLHPVTAIADQKTLTIDAYADGRQKRLYGAMGTWELSGEFGKQVFIEFTFSGLFSTLGDAALPTVTPTAAPPMLAKNATLTIGAYTPKISKFTIHPNNPVEAREDVTAPEGVRHYLVGPGRRYTVGMDPECEVAATWDIEALWLAGTEAAFSLVLSDGDVTITFAAPKVQQTAPQEGLRESKLIHEMTGQCNIDTGDDELTITAAEVV